MSAALGTLRTGGRAQLHRQPFTFRDDFLAIARCFGQPSLFDDIASLPRQHVAPCLIRCCCGHPLEVGEQVLDDQRLAGRIQSQRVVGKVDQTGEGWASSDDSQPSFFTAKRCLYATARHVNQDLRQPIDAKRGGARIVLVYCLGVRGFQFLTFSFCLLGRNAVAFGLLFLLEFRGALRLLFKADGTACEQPPGDCDGAEGERSLVRGARLPSPP